MTMTQTIEKENKSNKPTLANLNSFIKPISQELTQVYVIGPSNLDKLKYIPISIGTTNDIGAQLKALQKDSQMQLMVYNITNKLPKEKALRTIVNVYKGYPNGYEWSYLNPQLLEKLYKHKLIKDDDYNKLKLKLTTVITKVF